MDCVPKRKKLKVSIVKKKKRLIDLYRNHLSTTDMTRNNTSTSWTLGRKCVIMEKQKQKVHGFHGCLSMTKTSWRFLCQRRTVQPTRPSAVVRHKVFPGPSLHTELVFTLEISISQKPQALSRGARAITATGRTGRKADNRRGEVFTLSSLSRRWNSEQ